jgi:hypothetical protein
MNGETENGNGAAEQPQVVEQNRVRRTPPTETLPSDRLAFEKQVATLRAFVVVYEANGNKPVGNDEAGKIINMSGNTVVVTNGFFTDMRLLLRPKDSTALVPSAETLAFFKAYEWDQKSAGEKLRPVFEKAWFSEALVPRLKFRPYDEGEALTVLAEACSAAKEYEPRLRILLEYMVFAGVVVRDGAQIKLPGPKMPEALVEAGAPEAAAAKPGPAPVGENHAEFTFFLDVRRNRKVVVHAPHDISKKELKRVQKWMEIQLIEDETEDEQKA